MAPVVTMKQLLEAGVHFGHQTRRWNPKMKRFIYGERNGIYIIDLQQTLGRIETAYTYVRDMVADGGSILFVGTKKQAQDPIAAYADGCGMPYVNERWLGGMLTNFSTISGRVKKMQEYQRMRAVGDFDAMPKKEALMTTRELDKLERNLGGIRDMTGLPDAIFVIDTKKEHIGVTEANKLKIPVVAVVDTNCDPDLIDFVIPGNDDAIRSGTLMCRVISDAVKEGRFIAERRGTARPAPPAALTPEQEAEKSRQQADARNEAARAAAEREARLAAVRTAPPAPDASGPPHAEDADPVVTSQGSPVMDVPHSGKGGTHLLPEPSDVLEPNPGAIPAADDALTPPPVAAALPGSAGHVPVGSHGGQGLPPEEKAEAIAAERDPNEFLEATASPDVPPPAEPVAGASGEELPAAEETNE
jgi:small subunit ribosomal protein S2